VGCLSVSRINRHTCVEGIWSRSLRMHCAQQQCSDGHSSHPPASVSQGWRLGSECGELNNSCDLAYPEIRQAKFTNDHF